jgi:hypothetical protein
LLPEYITESTRMNFSDKLSRNSYGSLLILFLIISNVQADQPEDYWAENGGKVVRQGNEIIWQKSISSANPGELILCWSDTRFGIRKVLAQKLDSSQPDSPSVWSTSGTAALIISDQRIRQEDPHVVEDGAGGAIISWIDFRDDSNGDIYVNRIVDGISGTGELAWNESGVLVCTECTGGFYDNMVLNQCTDMDGGSWIAWTDLRSGSWDIYLSHVDSQGDIDPAFGANGLPVVTESSNQLIFDMHADGDGGVYIVWEDQRDPANLDIYLEHVLANGTFVSSENGLSVVSASGAQSNPSVVSTNASGCFVSWRDNREDLSGDIYVQHYNADLEADYPVNGVAIAALPNSAEINPQMTTTGDGSVLLAWQDNRHDEQNAEADIFIQKMTLDNTEHWGSGGVSVTLASSNQENLKVAGEENGGALLVWQVNNGTTDFPVYAQKLNESGQRLWSDGGKIVVENENNPTRTESPQVIPDKLGGMFIAWHDRSSGSVGVFTQHLDENGNQNFDITGDNSILGISGSCQSVQNVKTPDGVLVFWKDPRDINGPHIYVQKLSAETGSEVFVHNGKSVDDSIPGGQNNYVAISDDEGGAYIVFEAGGIGSQQSWLMRIDGNGDPVWDTSMPVTAAFDLESGLEYQENIKIVKAENNLFVAWSGVDIEHSYWMADVYVQSFDFAGNALWGDNALRITDSDDIHESFSDLLLDGLSNAYILWSSGSWSDTDIYVQKINAVGIADWPSTGLILAGGAGKQEDVQAMGKESGGLIAAWSDYQLDNSTSDLLARAIDEDGNDIWDPPITLIDYRSLDQNSPVLVPDAHGGAFISYSKFSNEAIYSINQRHLLADGSLQWQNSAGELFTDDYPLSDLNAAVIPRGSARGFIVAATIHEAPNDTITYTDIWVQDSHVVEDIADSYEENYSGTVHEIFHRQREPDLIYDGADGVYLSWLDMRIASCCDYIQNVYAARVAINSLSIDPDNVIQTASFKLAQNYPNPFNPGTQIEFQLYSPGNVNLGVYNLSGQLVRQLHSGELRAGTHAFEFEATDLSSGIYIYNLEANGISQSKRMILIK